MKSFRFAFSIVFSLLVVAAVACNNTTPAASPDDTVSSDDPTPTSPIEPPGNDDQERVEVPAPIDSVTISIAESFPPQYFVRIVSGLPNGCALYGGYDVTRAGDTVTIEVFNTEPLPTGEPIACTEIYGFHEENINLGSDFRGSITYTVVVNDKSETFVAQGGPNDGTDIAERVTEHAPIQDVRIDVSTDGTDYLVVTSGLPDSCHEFAEYSAERVEDRVSAELWNYRNDMEYVEVTDSDGATYLRSQPVFDVTCAENYSTVETEIRVGSDLQACKIYTVQINGETRDVQAIAPNVRCADPNQGTSEPTDTDSRVAVIAPIESAQVVSTRSIPPQHTLVVISGLPNGCAEFDGYEVEPQGNEIFVTITNTIPTATDIMCTEQHRTVATRILLGSDFETGDYVVIINGELMAKFSHIAIVRPGTGRDGVVPVPAPIDDVVVISTRSIPPQHTLVITSGLPNGCAEFDSYTIAQDGRNLRVRVTNTEPTGEAVCTDDYRTVETRVDLGSDFETGTYTIDVNGKTATFTHVALPPPPDGTTTVVAAPIVSVDVQAAGGTYGILITSALPNGCHRFNGYNVTREDNTIKITVTNTVPTDLRLMCTMVYGLVETEVSLGSDFEGGTTYIVDVNGEQTKFTPGAASNPSTREVAAPIINVAINAAESYPVQYFAEVESGLPGSCIVFDRYDEIRTFDVIEISVYNREPTDQAGCTNVHGSHVSNIPLGINFESGKKYTVVVNGEATAFVAEGKISDAPEEARIGTPFDLPLGQYAHVGEVGVRFEEVTEDSRCPANAICVWQGRVRIQITVDLDGTGENAVQLELEGVREDLALQVVGRYGVRLEAVNPYPGTTGAQKPEYVATLTVIEMMPDDVDLELRAEPNPDNPRIVKLVANIVGGADNSKELYCEGFEWSFGDGTPGLAAMPGCVPWTPEVTVPREFEMTHTYEKAGTFEATFSYGPLGPVSMKVEVK